MEEGMEKKERTRIVPYYKLFSFADSYDYMLMLVGTVAAVGNGCALAMISILFGDLIDSAGKSLSVGVSVAVHEVCQVSLKFLYLAVGTALASFMQVSCWMLTAERQAARIRTLYLRTIMRQDIAFFDMEVTTGEIVARMSSDTILIQDAIGEKVGSFIQVLASFVGGFAIAFTKGWHMTLAMLATIPLLAISGAMTVKLMARLVSNAQEAYVTAATVADQTIGSIRTVASFSGEERAIGKYNKALDKAYKSGVWEGLAAGLGFGTIAFVFFCSYAFAIWFGGKMIVEKGYTGGSILSVILAVLIGSFSLGQASPCLSAFAAGKAAASKMFDTISRKPDIDALDTKGLQLDNISGDIELRGIYFSYPSRPNEQVFCGLSLLIPSGSTAALVGESGSGKSTVISLVERFYDPQHGDVLIDGVNIKNFQLGWIRTKISLVSQEPVLFYASIRDNIAYGKEGASDEEILEAAELANAAKFIEMLPQGLETMVGEHGIHLSGGQKQRIAIARAILKDPKILLLDEATSALDVQSERIVWDALDRIMSNRTTLIVAHRLSTIKNADQIYVIHKGKIVEKGTHSELLENSGGVYSQLLLLQESVKKSEKVTANEPGNCHTPGTPSSISKRHTPGTPSSIPNRHTHGTPSSIPFDASPRLFFSGNTPARSHHTLFSVPFSLSPSRSFSMMSPAAALDSPDSDVSLKKKDFSLRRLAYLNKPEVPVLLLGILAAAASGIIYPFFGSLLSSIIKTFYEPGTLLLKHTKHWALMLVVLGSATLLTALSSNYLFAVAGCKLIKRIRSMCFEKVVFMEISWFDEDENSSGAIRSRLSSDATAVRALVGDSFGMLVQNFATAAAGLIIAFEANWQLSAFVLILLPLVGVSGYIQMKSLKGFSANAKKQYEEASQVVSDAVSSIRTVASFCAEERMVQLYQEKSEGPLKAGVRHGLLSGVGFGLSFFFQFFINAIIFYTGAELVKHGETTFTKVFRVFFALSMTALGISQANSLAPDANKARQSAASLFDILDQQSKIDARENSGSKLKNAKGEVKFHHVSFMYPTRPDIQIFKDLCLSIHPGQTVALVGESGSGKSTAISLLQRYYTPDSGHITLDGTDIRKLNIKWLRQQMGLVSQEPVLFNETIRANIAYGKEREASEAEIMTAAKLANAHKFISGLQHGYDTIVGERGVQLSGGQKQRVAIARAIIKAPKILLLDEATSALDAESERVVQDALHRVMLNRTTLVVAHRLSTIRKADVIAMIKNGCVVEKGKHERLMSVKKGTYASMVSVAPH